jgi:hypothetical protein
MRSPKFEATLRSNPNKNYMRLEGVEADIFELILRHIYGVEVEMNDYHQVGRLLAASCSLQIDGLVVNIIILCLHCFLEKMRGPFMSVSGNAFNCRTASNGKKIQLEKTETTDNSVRGSDFQPFY